MYKLHYSMIPVFTKYVNCTIYDIKLTTKSKSATLTNRNISEK